MVPPRELEARFEAYGDWRKRLASGISVLHEWLHSQDLADSRIDEKVRQMLDRLHQDRLVVAFVAEFSRGKSELINAIFFAELGVRLLPTTAGRTTMCPTELLHDPTRPPSIRLLPIESRLNVATVQDLRNHADEWLSFPLDLSSPDRMRDALARVAHVKRVPVEVARSLGLAGDRETAAPPASGGEGAVEVPCWRHAIINFPHPLLQKGLVILDTPGLNAIGTEPELTLCLLPSAHAVLFVLAADAGVTQTDLEVWRAHLAGEAPGERDGRIVVLNKIDGLWDELKPEAAIADEIDRQIVSTAATLGLPRTQVYATSAQKALLAKVSGDASLLDRSRLPALEEALAEKLLPAKREIVGAATRAEARALTAAVRQQLDVRRQGIAGELAELRTLRGRNQDVVVHTLDRVREEKERFESGLQRYTALRTVFTDQTNSLYDAISTAALRGHAGRTRRGIERSTFSTGVRAAMNDFFTSIRRDFDEAARRSEEIQEMMQAMYARFSEDLGLENFAPPPFSMQKYRAEIDRLARTCDEQFNSLWTMLSTAKFALNQRFFETIASEVKHIYRVANRDIENWLLAVMTPLETQVREHHAQLRRRLESVKRIHHASGDLEQRIEELERQDETVAAQVAALLRSAAEIDDIVARPEGARAAMRA